MISGGARGITALVAAELARTWRPTLLMIGTTPLPESSESAETAGLSAEAEIKAALHARFRHEGGPRAPPRSNRPINRSGAPARSGRTSRSFARPDRPSPMPRPTCATPAHSRKFSSSWRARYGEPVGLIHGAGLIKDKLIRQKSIESFDRVLETKLYGALNLIRLVRQETLKFTVLFSSIAGRSATSASRITPPPTRSSTSWPTGSIGAGRARALGDLGPMVGRRHGLAARKASGQTRPRHDLTRRGTVAAGR